MSKVLKLIAEEKKRQKGKINLIASENVVSDAIREAVGSELTNKYAEGYPGKRYYGGCEVVDEIEDYARDLAKKIFGAQHANVQPHCGSASNMGVYMALLNPGDTVLAMSLDAGGHLTHGANVSFSGKLYNFVHYGLDDKGVLDYKQLEELAWKHRPKLIVAGGSAYSLVIDFERIANVAKAVGAVFMVDMAHFAGLVAAGVHPNPCLVADIVTSTTHKTLRGPRAGIILCREEFAKKIDSAIFPGIQGGPLCHVIAGKAICFEEAMTEEYRDYMKRVVHNADYLAKALQKLGLKIISGGTQTHLFMVDLSDTEKSGKEVQETLEAHNIVVNKNKIQNDKRGAIQTSGIRIGTPFITNFPGLDDACLDELASIIAAVVKGEPIPPKKLLAKVFN